MHAQFLHKHMLKNMCQHTHLRTFDTYVFFCFSLCAFCGILVHNKKQDKRQFLQTPLKVSLLTKKWALRFSFAMVFDRTLQSNHWTNEKKNVRIFIYLVLQVIHVSKCLEGENTLLLEFQFEMKCFDVPNMNSACKWT